MTLQTSALLKTVQSFLDREATTALCQTCWAIVGLHEDHVCDPEARAAAMVRAIGFVVTDDRRRAKGYGVQ